VILLADNVCIIFLTTVDSNIYKLKRINISKKFSIWFKMAKKSSSKSASDAFDDYLEKKKKLRKLHQRLKDTKDNQEIYHKIMGSTHDDEATEVDSNK